MSGPQITIDIDDYAEGLRIAEQIRDRHITDRVRIRTRAPHTLYSVITDYGTGPEGIVAEHFGSPETRLRALRERTSHLVDNLTEHLMAHELAAVIEQVFAATSARVILTEATRRNHGHWHSEAEDAHRVTR